jgi:hypothetical protein
VNSKDPASPPCRSSVGDERRLGVGRRLLLVLTVVAGADLASEAPEDERRDGERRQDAERKDDERRPPGMRDRVVDRSLSRSYCFASSSSSATILSSPLPSVTRMPAVDVKALRG